MEGTVVHDDLAIGKPGSIFQDVTGHSVDEFDHISDIEALVEDVHGQEVSVWSKVWSFISRRGNIFDYDSTSPEEIDRDVDKRIRRLEKIQESLSISDQ